MKKRAKVSFTTELLQALLHIHYKMCGDTPPAGNIYLVEYDASREVIHIYLDDGFEVADGTEIPNI